jgi:hypothetical protein
VTKTIGVLVVAMTLGRPTVPPRSVAGLELPADLADYKRWTQLLKVPYAVPLELWIRCMAPTPADWEAARKKYGPHTKRFIRVYGNSTALEAVSKAARPALPVGSVLVKEKLPTSPHASPDGLAFMVKHPVSDFPETGGWQFLYFPSSAGRQQTQEACASCHRTASANDYVFGQYPR